MGARMFGNCFVGGDAHIAPSLMKQSLYTVRADVGTGPYEAAPLSPTFFKLY